MGSLYLGATFRFVKLGPFALVGHRLPTSYPPHPQPFLHFAGHLTFAPPNEGVISLRTN